MTISYARQMRFINIYTFKTNLKTICSGDPLKAYATRIPNYRILRNYANPLNLSNK